MGTVTIRNTTRGELDQNLRAFQQKGYEVVRRFREGEFFKAELSYPGETPPYVPPPSQQVTARKEQQQKREQETVTRGLERLRTGKISRFRGFTREQVFETPTPPKEFSQLIKGYEGPQYSPAGGAGTVELINGKAWRYTKSGIWEPIDVRQEAPYLFPGLYGTTERDFPPPPVTLKQPSPDILGIAEQFRPPPTATSPPAPGAGALIEERVFGRGIPYREDVPLQEYIRPRWLGEPYRLPGEVEEEKRIAAQRWLGAVPAGAAAGIGGIFTFFPEIPIVKPLARGVATGFITAPIGLPVTAYSLFMRPEATLKGILSETRARPVETVGELIGGAYFFGKAPGIVRSFRTPRAVIEPIVGVRVPRFQNVRNLPGFFAREAAFRRLIMKKAKKGEPVPAIRGLVPEYLAGLERQRIVFAEADLPPEFKGVFAKGPRKQVVKIEEIPARGKPTVKVEEVGGDIIQRIEAPKEKSPVRKILEPFFEERARAGESTILPTGRPIYSLRAIGGEEAGILRADAFRFLRGRGAKAEPSQVTRFVRVTVARRGKGIRGGKRREVTQVREYLIPARFKKLTPDRPKGIRREPIRERDILGDLYKPGRPSVIRRIREGVGELPRVQRPRVKIKKKKLTKKPRDVVQQYLSARDLEALRIAESDIPELVYGPTRPTELAGITAVPELAQPRATFRFTALQPQLQKQIQKQGLRTSQLSFTKQQQLSLLGQKPMERVAERLDVSPLIINIQKSFTGQMQKQKPQTRLAQEQKLVPPPPRPPVPKPPRVFRPRPPGRRFPIIPDLMEEPRRKKKMKVKKLPTAKPVYRPSLIGIVSGITATKAPKRVTGLGVRPIIRKSKGRRLI